MKTLLSSALVASLLAGITASPVTPAPQAQTTTTSVVFPTYVSLQPAQVTALQRELLMVPSEVDREAILFPNPNPNTTNSANNVTFQFVNTPVTLPQAGNVVVGSVNNIPGLIGTNVA